MYDKQLQQAPDPAMADPSSLVRAAQLQGQAAQQQAAGIAGAIKGVGQVYEMGVEQDILAAQRKGEDLQKELFMSNQAARVATDEYGQLSSKKESFFDANLALTPDQYSQAASQLKGFDEKLAKLKSASQGGMKMSDYTTRVSSLTREAIAQHPQYADDIRKRVGASTGLESADLWAQRDYVNRQLAAMNKTGGTDPMVAIIKKDVESIASAGIMSAEEAYTLRTSDPAKYAVVRGRALELTALSARAQAVDNTVKAAQQQSGFDADTFVNVSLDMFNTGFNMSMAQQMTHDPDKSLATTSELLAKGNTEVVDPVKFKVLSDQHVARISGLADQNYMAANAQLDQYITKQNVPLAKANEMRTTLRNRRDEYKKMYGSEGSLALMASIHVGYRDKTLKEQQEVFNMSWQMMQSIPKDQMTAYIQGGASKENLKRQAPDVYALIETNLKVATTSGNTVITSIAAARDLDKIKQVTVEAGKTGDVVVGPEDATPEQVRAGHQVMQQQTTTILDKADLTPSEKQLVKATMATNMAKGANSKTLRTDYNKLQGKLKTQSPEVVAAVKEGVSNGTAIGLRSVADVKTQLEAKYGVKLELGVNDAGELAVIENQTPDKGTFTNYASAYKEFTHIVKPILSNLVVGRAMVTEEDRKAVAIEYASVLNGKIEYTPFFSSKAKPVPEPTAPVAAPTPEKAPVKEPEKATTSDEKTVDSEVKRVLTSMKKLDPNLNVDYMYNAYLTADPKEKAKLKKTLFK